MGDGRHVGEGIHAEIRVENPECCRIAQASKQTDSPITTIEWSGANPDAIVIEDFATTDTGAAESAAAETIFETERYARHRFHRKYMDGCICDEIEQLGAPIESVHANRGSLTVTFYVSDVGELRHIITRLRDEYDGVRIRRLHHAGDGDDCDLVFVDRNRLTDRQREVLETAHEMGYFESPKMANAGEVADEIGISPSTLTDHLAAAQSKLLDAIIEGDWSQ